MKSSTDWDMNKISYLPSADRAVALSLLPTVLTAPAVAPTTAVPADAVERTKARPGIKLRRTPVKPRAIEPAPDPPAPPTSALTSLFVEKITPTDMMGPIN